MDHGLWRLQLASIILLVALSVPFVMLLPETLVGE